MINWKVRIKNDKFWIELSTAVLRIIQAAEAVFGFNLDLSELGNRLLDVVNALFAVLAIMGVVVDPTTEGIGDSERALNYDRPAK